MDAQEIGREIARIRRLRGLTQAELARRVGTQQPAIARIEQGRTLPSLRTLLRIAEALNARLHIHLEPLNAKGDANAGVEEDIQDLLLVQSRKQTPDYLPLEEFLEGLEMGDDREASG